MDDGRWTTGERKQKIRLDRDVSRWVTAPNVIVVTLTGLYSPVSCMYSSEEKRDTEKGRKRDTAGSKDTT